MVLVRIVLWTPWPWYGHWNVSIASDLGRVSQNLKSTQPVARICESKELRANILN